MIFTDRHFLFGFLPAALILHYLATRIDRGTRYGNCSRLCIFLLTLYFYGYTHTWWLAPFAVGMGFDFVWSSMLHRAPPGRRKLILCASITQNLLLLGTFKYSRFFLANLRVVSPSMANALAPIVSLVPAAMPAGISFYTFESLSFVIDVYRNEIEPPKNPLEFFAFIGMFPRFIAGPIVRYQTIVGQFLQYRGMQIKTGLFLFLFGFMLKNGFADNFASFVSYAYPAPKDGSLIAAWMGVAAYGFQVYFDFSGYSLMAIGLGRCLGFQFPTNFNRPYLARTVLDFWGRWHMSFTAWIRHYLFTPLAIYSARRSKFHFVLSVFFVLFVSGLWHGANWTYIVFGFWHGAWLCLERVPLFSRRSPLFKRVLTLGIVFLGWVLFRSDNLSDSFHLYRVMLDPFHASLAFSMNWITANPECSLICLCGLIYCFFIERLFDSPTLENLPDVSALNWSYVLILSALCLDLSEYPATVPFLYFQF